MTSSEYWSRLCDASKSVELAALLDRARGTSATAISSYFVTALISLSALISWHRVEANVRSKFWRLCGRFLGLTCAGSCCGVISWVANMLFLEYDFRSTQDKTLTIVQRHVFVAVEHLWHAVFLAFCASLLHSNSAL
jgi:hypothetical protein